MDMDCIHAGFLYIFQGMLRLYLSTLEKFSSIISPLISVSYLQVSCTSLRALYFTVIPNREEEQSYALAWSIPAYFIAHHVLCLMFSTAVSKKVRSMIQAVT